MNNQQPYFLGVRHRKANWENNFYLSFRELLPSKRYCDVRDKRGCNGEKIILVM